MNTPTSTTRTVRGKTAGQYRDDLDYARAQLSGTGWTGNLVARFVSQWLRAHDDDPLTADAALTALARDAARVGITSERVAFALSRILNAHSRAEHARTAGYSQLPAGTIHTR